MAKTKSLDILLVGRPDHSMMIYDSLSRQGGLSYHFITFKVLPHWCRFLAKRLRAQTVNGHVSISWVNTFVNVCRYSYRFGFASRWSERGRLAPLFRRVVRGQRPSLIHYWSSYANDEIEKYAKRHPEVRILKDIHMPSYLTVAEAMAGVGEKYGLPDLSASWREMIPSQLRELENLTEMIVPSEYVLNSYRRMLPDKKYHLVSYGITAFGNYTKKCAIGAGHKFKFVYVGRISLEKGCDLLFGYFKDHREYELHVYGAVTESQSAVFDSLKSPNICLHGSVAKADVQSEVSKYDIGIHLSRFDAYSLGVGEIIGAGLPVIVSCSTGNEADIRANNWGLVTGLATDEIDTAVRNMCNPEAYNCFVDSIDDYIKSGNIGYGDRMITKYREILNLRQDEH